MTNETPSNGNGKLSAVFWMRVASITFGLWALVLPISASIVVERINDIAAEQRRVADTAIAYRERVEQRLLLLEERQADVRARLRDVELDIYKEARNNKAK